MARCSCRRMEAMHANQQKKARPENAGGHGHTVGDQTHPFIPLEEDKARARYCGATEQGPNQCGIALGGEPAAGLVQEHPTQKQENRCSMPWRQPAGAHLPVESTAQRRP